MAEATGADGTAAVLKVLVLSPGKGDANEATVLRLTGGDGCPLLYRHDPERRALLMERLGRPMYELGIPLARRHEILCATAARVWRPAPDCGLASGADRARRLADFIVTMWNELDRPCSEEAVDYALDCARRRVFWGTRAHLRCGHCRAPSRRSRQLHRPGAAARRGRRVWNSVRGAS